jgi:hypothetical protein
MCGKKERKGNRFPHEYRAALRVFASRLAFRSFCMYRTASPLSPADSATYVFVPKKCRGVPPWSSKMEPNSLHDLPAPFWDWAATALGPPVAGLGK